ncbi:neuropeptide y receptor [Holotrichia oblita]|uniref:Neuropeptide y receptor n=1 Tax=Holotrichia oblita TaxID=644536 RepID=A0ACB9SPG2_HOLOL|nr:neuropeptide y receptor [Holotrichia oblita]
MECAFLLVSVMNLSAISYDRLTAIVLPKETRLNRKGAKILIAITWVSGFVLASPLCVYRTYKERQWLDFLEKYCTEEAIVVNIYWHVIITMMLNHYERSVKRKAILVNANYKAKVAKAMFVVVITFTLCKVPFTALIFYRNQLLRNNGMSNNHQVQNQVNGTYMILWLTSKYLIFLNAAINPVIYGLTNEKFRRAFKTTALSRCLFGCENNKRTPKPAVKRKQTKEIVMQDSHKSKIFVIFKNKHQRNNNNNQNQQQRRQEG